MELSVGAWVGIAAATLFVLLGISHYWFNSKYISVSKKAYLVTGGSSGIGKAVAQTLLEKGASVALVARKLEGLEKAKAELLASTGADESRVSVHAADITSEDAVKAAVAGTVQLHGSLDGIICSAGTSMPKLFEATSAEDWTWLLQLNIVGTRNVVAAALPHLKETAGRIVLVSSSAGQVGVFGFSAYSASKFALTGLAQALSQELRIFGIDVTVFFPADTETPLLEEENRLKPETCKKISETGGLQTAEDTGKSLVRAMQHGWGTASTGVLSELLTVGMGGAGGWSSVFELLVSSFTSGLVRLVLGLLHLEWNGYIDKYAKADYAAWREREQSAYGGAAGTEQVQPASTSVRRSPRARKQNPIE